ncbi:transposase [Sphaerisporangium melleum]|uniref:transposase n=1 Tax=Sphaerisporangium melleum TaxID=321316 RepID=UPI003555C7A3
MTETPEVQALPLRRRICRFAGTAPVPVWSGNSNRARLNQGGNRRMNASCT